MKFIEKFKGSSVKFVVVWIGLVLVLVSLLSVFFVIFLVGGDNAYNHEKSSSRNYYQIIKLNPNTNETSVGIMSSSKEQVQSSFVSKKGNYILISDFGMEEFKCTGYCYCGNERRSNSISISRGLIYLVATTSSFLAMNIAKKHFENDCEEQISNTCPLHLVRSDVEDCEPLIKEQSTKDEKSEEKSETGKEYWCTGHCILNPKLESNFISHGLSEDYIKLLQKSCDEESTISASIFVDKDDAEEARKKFHSNVLKEYCERFSVDMENAEGFTGQGIRMADVLKNDPGPGPGYEDGGPVERFGEDNNDVVVRMRRRGSGSESWDTTDHDEFLYIAGENVEDNHDIFCRRKN